MVVALLLQRMTAFLKVFRCGPGRNGCVWIGVGRVDKPRKEEAAGSLVETMGKVQCTRFSGRTFGGHGGGRRRFVE